MSNVFGIKEDVVDFYGFTEQMGITYPDASDRVKCTPIYSEVIVRDPFHLNPYQMVKKAC